MSRFVMQQGGFTATLAQSDDDLRAAQRLRYDVFVTELGAAGPDVDHSAKLERDPFDPFADHLLLREDSSDEVIAVYRLLRSAQAKAAGGFYTQSEYDLGPLLSQPREVLELGRSCVRADHRGGAALFHMWAALGRYIELHNADILFGVASLKGTDIDALAPALSILHHRYLAPPDLRPRAQPFQPMDLIAPEKLDRKQAMIALPPLIKSYLRLGGMVGQGAFVDHAFNCTDVCMVMDTAALSSAQVQRFQEAAR